MTNTNRLALPYLAAAQSQKHVTHNEALQMLDALVQISVLEKDRASPPASPSEGMRYLVGAAPSGGFAGQAGRLAAFDDGAWRFLEPQPGWLVHVAAGNSLILFDGAGWRDIAGLIGSLGNLATLGVGTSADAGNPLSAKLNDALFTARFTGEGGTGSLRLKLNKEGPSAAVSQLYQSGWSGRAETGLTGDDRFRIKVSADGSTWRDSLLADPATGAVSFPSGVSDLGGGGLSELRNHVLNGDFWIAQRGGGPVRAHGGAELRVRRVADPCGRGGRSGAGQPVGLCAWPGRRARRTLLRDVLDLGRRRRGSAGAADAP